MDSKIFIKNKKFIAKILVFLLSACQPNEFRASDLTCKHANFLDSKSSTPALLNNARKLLISSFKNIYSNKSGIKSFAKAFAILAIFPATLFLLSSAIQPLYFGQSHYMGKGRAAANRLSILETFLGLGVTTAINASLGLKKFIIIPAILSAKFITLFIHNYKKSELSLKNFTKNYFKISNRIFLNRHSKTPEESFIEKYGRGFCEYTELYLICNDNDLKILQCVLENSPELLKNQDLIRNLLCWACRADNKNTVQYLIDKGADTMSMGPNIVHKTYTNGDKEITYISYAYPIKIAIKNKCQNATKILIPKYSNGYLYHNSYSLLSKAIEMNNPEIITLLIKQGATDLFGFYGSDDGLVKLEKILNLSGAFGNKKIMQKFCSTGEPKKWLKELCNDKSLTLLDKILTSAHNLSICIDLDKLLYAACDAENTNTVQYLIEKGANPNAVGRDPLWDGLSKGRSIFSSLFTNDGTMDYAIQLAITQNCPKIAKILVPLCDDKVLKTKVWPGFSNQITRPISLLKAAQIIGDDELVYLLQQRKIWSEPEKKEEEEENHSNESRSKNGFSSFGATFEGLFGKGKKESDQSNFENENGFIGDFEIAGLDLNERTSLGSVLKLKPRTAYDILGIKNKRAKIKEIKRAYKNMAMESHPDRNNSSKDDKMTEINSAKDVLLNEKLRDIYDKQIGL